MDDSVMHVVKEWLWGPLLGLIAWAWAHLNGRVDTLKEYTDTEVGEVRTEVTRQRDISAKIFDKLEEHGRRSDDRHFEIMKTLHEGLSRKVDK